MKFANSRWFFTVLGMSPPRLRRSLAIFAEPVADATLFCLLKGMSIVSVSG
jgi:hypothetical protein